MALGRDLLVGVSLLTLLLSSWDVRTALAQTDFLSIDCGATEQYQDNDTGILWDSDSRYIKYGIISSNIPAAPQNLPNRYRNLRYFPGNRSKSCYDIPAINGSVYLVRATFLYGDYDGGIRKPAFQVHVDTVNVGLVWPNSSDSIKVIEVTTAAAADNIYLCLAPNIPGTDVPFINFIELRMLAQQMYPKARQGYMLINEYRYNFGGPNVSFPNDIYDRHWFSFSALNAPNTPITSPQNVSVTQPLSRDEAPVEVMNTALSLQKDSPVTLPLGVTGGSNYVVLLWLAEIDTQALTSTREFEVGIDGNWQQPIEILDKTGRQLYQAYEWGFPSVNLADTSSIDFRATNRSILGPLINGMEVFAVSDPVQPRTDVGDVAAIEIIKTHWNLSYWTGDPCLNVPYDWTECSVDGIPRVTKLKLAGYNLTGSIPDSGIQNLTELTILWLENNALMGSVPNMSSLTKLQQLHLQNNDLSGEFPAWVADLPALTELFMEGNNFTGSVPSSLFNRPGLTFTYTTSSGLSASVAAASANSSESTKTIGIIIGCVVAGLSLVAMVIFVALFLLWRKRKQERDYWRGGYDPAMDSKAQTMAYSLNEVKAATNNFKDLLGEGSFGPVYKGILSDGREVAVKRCRPRNRQGALEFFDEVELLSRVHHRNLAALVGYCQESQEQILLYEYISNSDLQTHLHGNGKLLPWRTRLNIALDAAQGLEYLHTGCTPSIIHRDVNPANILLSSRMVAKVANFGFAKFTSEQDPTLEVYSFDVKGTAGYLDPEYMLTRQLTDKSDVYGFGVVLLELISGQEVIYRGESERDPLLVEWMRPLLGAGELKAVVDPSLGDKYNLECMWKVAELGMMCVEPKGLNRPTISDVVREIQEAIALEETVQAPMSPFSLQSAAARSPLSTPSPLARSINARD
ncbi:hypothetical protein M758_10G067600 [Ceratodon purpureus]|nr:hypothetical protein M758_10G067600 [Ceratodon purpureus]